MRLTRCVQQLRFNIAKHFTANPDVQAYTMEDLGHKVNSFYKSGFWDCTKKTWRLLDRQGDKRFGYSTTFKLLDDEAVAYIRGLTENQEFVSKESQNYQNSKSTRNKKNLTRQIFWNISDQVCDLVFTFCTAELCNAWSLFERHLQLQRSRKILFGHCGRGFKVTQRYYSERSSKLRPNECLGGCPIRGTPPTWTFRPRWVWTRRFSTGIWTLSPSPSSSMSRTCRKRSRGEAPYWGDTMMGIRHELIRQTFFYQPFSFSQMGPLSLLVFFWQSFMQFVEFLWVKKFAPFKKIVSVSFSMVSSATAGTGFQ